MFIYLISKQRYAPFRVKNVKRSKEIYLQMVGVRDQENHDPQQHSLNIGNYNLRGSKLCPPLRVEAKSVKAMHVFQKRRPD